MKKHKSADTAHIGKNWTNPLKGQNLAFPVLISRSLFNNNKKIHRFLLESDGFFLKETSMC